MSGTSGRPPRHALDCELSPRLPDSRVREAMAAFYKHSEGYAEQQGSHDAGYFGRLLGVMEAVLSGPNLRILEVGAGSAGAMRAFLARKPDARPVAMELSSASLSASRRAGAATLRAVAGNALQLPFRDRSLDAVVAFEVLEHIPDVAHALEEAIRVVRRPGFIIIGLPNHASLWTPVEDRLRRRQRLAFGVDRGRGAWRWWRRNAGLAWRKRLMRDAEFLYREPILHASAGGDADAVYYAAPIDLLRFFGRRGAQLVTTSARLRLGWPGRFVPVELQGSTVMAWRID
ncbi:MAG TPA: class I SAM-dependent methyltransferase [Vicinamibacterales bacterium]|nr:class I SAM-dependent methyltransferase [Vicinamibacterales bacterium]